jgi:hypothetical protein
LYCPRMLNTGFFRAKITVLHVIMPGFVEVNSD